MLQELTKSKWASFRKELQKNKVDFSEIEQELEFQKQIQDIKD